MKDNYLSLPNPNIVSILVPMFALMLMTIMLMGANVVKAESREIIYTKNLAVESAAAVKQGKFFLLYVSRPDCPYCESLKKDVLHPLLKGKRFDHLLVLRELSLVDESVIDFDNKKRTAGSVLAKYEIVGTPTLLFLDEKGEQLTSKLSGYFSKDFYWSYFENGVAKAIAKLNKD